MPDPADPHRKKKRAKRPEPDFVIDPSKPNATIELETADLLQLGQSGLVEGRANRTRDLQRANLDPKVVVDLGPDPNAPPKEQNVFVDFGPEPSSAGSGAQMPAAQRVPTEPAAAPSQPASVVVDPSLRPRQATPLRAASPVQLATPVNVQRVTSTMPKVEVATPRSTPQLLFPDQRRGMGIVVCMYLFAAAALAVSVYFRWFA